MLTGSITVVNGFILLKKSSVEVLGGSVEPLLKKWKVHQVSRPLGNILVVNYDPLIFTSDSAGQFGEGKGRWGKWPTTVHEVWPEGWLGGSCC